MEMQASSNYSNFHIAIKPTKSKVAMGIGKQKSSVKINFCIDPLSEGANHATFNAAWASQKGCCIIFCTASQKREIEKSRILANATRKSKTITFPTNFDKIPDTRVKGALRLAWALFKIGKRSAAIDVLNGDLLISTITQAVYSKLNPQSTQTKIIHRFHDSLRRYWWMTPTLRLASQQERLTLAVMTKQGQKLLKKIGIPVDFIQHPLTPITKGPIFRNQESMTGLINRRQIAYIDLEEIKNTLMESANEVHCSLKFAYKSGHFTWAISKNELLAERTITSIPDPMKDFDTYFAFINSFDIIITPPSKDYKYIASGVFFDNLSTGAGQIASQEFASNYGINKQTAEEHGCHLHPNMDGKTALPQILREYIKSHLQATKQATS